MVGVFCVPINAKAGTVVLFSRSHVTNVGSLSDFLGVGHVQKKKSNHP